MKTTETLFETFVGIDVSKLTGKNGQIDHPTPV
jgi:hypothetical protein